MDNSPTPAPNPPQPPVPTITVAPPPHHGRAHNLIIVYVCVLLAAILTGIVYTWQNGKVKNLNKQLSSASAQVTDLKKQVAAAEAAIPSNTNAGNAPNNPYAGWKTFCDNFSNVCLRYPKDWDIEGSTTSSKTSQTITNASSSAVITYDNPYNSDKQEQVFYIADFQDLTIKNLGPRIVGRSIGSSPSYVLVDGTYLTASHISVGQSLSFVNNAAFTTNVKGVTARLFAAPTGAALANIKTPDQSTAWFKTDDAKTSLKILQSLYYQ